MNKKPEPCCQDPKPRRQTDHSKRLNQVPCESCQSILAVETMDNRMQLVWKSPDGTTRYEESAMSLSPPYLLPHTCTSNTDVFCMACLRVRFEERKKQQESIKVEKAFEPVYDEIDEEVMVMLAQEENFNIPDFIPPSQRT